MDPGIIIYCAYTVAIFLLVAWTMLSGRWEVGRLGKLGVAALVLGVLGWFADLSLAGTSQAGSKLIVLLVGPVALSSLCCVAAWSIYTAALTIARFSRDTTQLLIRRRRWVAGSGVVIGIGGLVYIGDLSLALGLGAGSTAAAWTGYGWFLLRAIGWLVLGVFGLALLASVLGSPGLASSGWGGIKIGDAPPPVNMRTDPIATLNAEDADAKLHNRSSPLGPF